MVVDDYDFFSTGAKTAVSEFMELANADGERYLLEVADPRLGYWATLSRL